jgi:hypothetical protein
MDRGILALSVEDDAGCGADGVIDLNSSGLASCWFFGTVRASLLANALFVALVMSPVWTSIGIPARFSLSLIVTQLGALKTVVGDFLRHKG